MAVMACGKLKERKIKLTNHSMICLTDRSGQHKRCVCVCVCVWGGGGGGGGGKATICYVCKVHDPYKVNARHEYCQEFNCPVVEYYHT